MKKVVYFNRSKLFGRVFVSLHDKAELQQTIVTSHNGNFNISDVRTFGADIKKAQSIVDKIEPDVLVQTEAPERIIVPPTTKRIFVNHGIMHKASLVPLNSGSWRAYKKFDLYCGQTELFGKFIDYMMGGDNCNILYDTLPQLDLISTNYCTSYKNEILKLINFNPDLIILFCVSCCKDIPKFKGHNADYFETILKLSELAIKNNWLVIVKPRYNNKKMISAASKVSGWKGLYIDPYKKMLQKKSKHILFLDHDDDIYRYLFADVVLINGTTTFEIEAIIANKPVIITRINKRNQEFYDPFESIKRGAVCCVNSTANLEKLINEKTIDIERQKEFLEWYGIRRDGKAHERLQDAVTKI